MRITEVSFISIKPSWKIKTHHSDREPIRPRVGQFQVGCNAAVQRASKPLPVTAPHDIEKLSPDHQADSLRIVSPVESPTFAHGEVIV
jgi:hypothetical protein